MESPGYRTTARGTSLTCAPAAR